MGASGLSHQLEIGPHRKGISAASPLHWDWHSDYPETLLSTLYAVFEMEAINSNC
jgi:hypothetical protein